MIWFLSKYERTGDEFLVKEWSLATLETTNVIAAFAGSGIQLIYEVTEAQRPFVERLIGERLRFESFSYFVEATASETGETMDSEGEAIYLPPRSLPAFPDARRVAPKSSLP